MSGKITYSLPSGTWFADQFAATLHLPPSAPTQLLVTTSACAASAPITITPRHMSFFIGFSFRSKIALILSFSSVFRNPICRREGS